VFKVTNWEKTSLGQDLKQHWRRMAFAQDETIAMRIARATGADPQNGPIQINEQINARETGTEMGRAR
jgi:3-oxoacyl-(acyl-carrier-protein) synthase